MVSLVNTGLSPWTRVPDTDALPSCTFLGSPLPVEFVNSKRCIAPSFRKKSDAKALEECRGLPPFRREPVAILSRSKRAPFSLAKAVQASSSSSSSSSSAAAATSKISEPARRTKIAGKVAVNFEGQSSIIDRERRHAKSSDRYERGQFSSLQEQTSNSGKLSFPVRPWTRRVVKSLVNEHGDDLESRHKNRAPYEMNRRPSKVKKKPESLASEDFFSIRPFTDIGANEGIIQSLSSMQVKKPSQIQAMSYKHIYEGSSCILADQTGSGKTLAYLAPLFHRFIAEEEQGVNKAYPNRPRCLVVVPTSELAAQVLTVCRHLSLGGTHMKSMVATGGFRLKTQVDSLKDAPDVVIATPGRFLQLFDSGSLVLDNLASVVLDEVDILFDDPEFSDALEKIETSAPIKTQYIHVTATLPVDVCDAILEKHPTSLPLMGPGLHRTASGLQEVLVDCSGEGGKNPETAYENKRNALLQLFEQQPVSKTIVFCNKIETCRKVENALKRFDRKGEKIVVLPYHAAVSVETRHENMQQFIKVDTERSKVLVCTDRASRGLDLADVEHVILFDFPRDPSEYVRRVGRTARAGGYGKAFVFVVGKQVSLARKIMDRNEKGRPIHRVPTHSY